MKIYQGIISLDYDPATDVLMTSMPDVQQYCLSDISISLGIIVANIRIYDIKKLLLVANRSVLTEENEAYTTIMMQFARDLIGTRLEKLALVSTNNALCEAETARIESEVRQEFDFPIEHRDFTSQDEAMAWLVEKPTIQCALN